MKSKISIQPKDGERVIVISDVHGHLNHLKKMLEALDILTSDYLIILGDFINRGSDSYSTLKYVQTLNLRERTIVLKGNHEYFVETIMSSYENFVRFKKFYDGSDYETLIQSMMIHDKVNFEDFDSPKANYDFLWDKYSEELNYIKELPIIVEDEHHIFVHGGYDESFSLNDEGKFLKYDNYNQLSKVNNKYVVVGHWPSCNLRTDRVDNTPYFNHDKKIIFIDGGLGVKDAGELNALIINRNGSDDSYESLLINDFKSSEVVNEHIFEIEDTIYINYPDFEFDIVRRGLTSSLGIHKASGKFFTIFNDLLITTSKGDELKTTYVNNFLNLKVGTLVNVVIIIGNYAFVKHKETFGWLLNNQLK